MPGDRAQLAGARHDRVLVALEARLLARHQAVEPGAHRVALVLGDRELEPVLADDLLLGPVEHGAALAVEHQHARLGVDDQDHRPGDVEVALRAVALGAQRGLHAAALVGLEPAALEVLRELPADRREHRDDLRVRLLDRGGEELEHARAVVGERDRERRGRRQPGAQRVRLARHVAVGGDVRRPGGPPERVGAAGHAAAGRDRHAARDVGERLHVGAGGAVVPDRRAAQHAAVVVGAPDGAEGPAQRLAERRERAGAQLVRREPGGDVVGDRLLREQQPVRPGVGDDALDHLGHARGVGREDRVGLEALHKRREVARADGRHGRDERQLRRRPSGPAPSPCARARGARPRRRR